MSRKWLERTEKLFGEQTIDDLSQKTVAVLGLGGVGGAAAEAVCRMGVGKLVLNRLLPHRNSSRFCRTAQRCVSF